MKRLQILFTFCLIFFAACSSSDVEDAIDLAEGVPRKTIDTSKLGVNAFLNDGRFGSIDSQLADVRNTLKLGYVRLLFAWNDDVQPSPSSNPNFGFYDAIAGSLPPGIDAIVVLTGVPSWMSNSANWIDGNPRKTFVEQWVRKVTRRYAGNSRIIGWQIWNEPNMTANPDNGTLGIGTNVAAYVEMLRLGFNVVREVSPQKLVLNAATTAINQNYPETLNYNKDMEVFGAKDYVDVWAVHYYGKQYENVIRGGGVQDFLNGLGKEVWVTESGDQGINNQLAYGEEVWPFLIDKIPSISRIYCYQYTEATPADVTYGLRNLTPGLTLSDLYIYLRDR